MANWLNFEKLKEWDAVVFQAFQYDAISDGAIELALADVERLRQVDTNQDWEDDAWLRDAAHGIPDEQKHAYRVAALVHAFRNGQPMRDAIHLDTGNLGQCGCGVGNGHHRIRALQFLGLKAGPFDLSGYVSMLERLVAKAGCVPLTEHAAYFVPRLMVLEEFDIKPLVKKPRVRKKTLVVA